MSNTSKQSIGSTAILILLGFIALFAGAKWLIVLIPAATLVWCYAIPLRNRQHTTRN